MISFVLSPREQCNIVFLKGEKALVFKEHIRVQGIPTSILFMDLYGYLSIKRLY